MKNIHLIPTDKPSRLLYFGTSKELTLQINPATFRAFERSLQHIYITNDEEIKEGSLYLNNKVIFKADDIFNEGNNPNNSNPRVTDFNKKIILTTDQDLIKDGVQAIDDEFLEWFVNNPSCEGVEVDRIELNTDYRSDWKQKFYYKVIIPKEELKQETLEEAVNKFKKTDVYINEIKQEIVKDLAYWKTNAVEDYMKVPISVLRYISELENQMCSVDGMRSAWEDGRKFEYDHNGGEGGEFTGAESFEEWFEQFKKK